MTPQAPEPVPEAMIGLAASALTEHTNHAALCAVCGCAWPCERAALAEHTVAAAL